MRRVVKGLVKIGLIGIVIAACLIALNKNACAYWEHYKNVQVAAGSYLVEPFPVTSLPQGAILTNVSVQFTYVAYNGAQSYLSARVGKGFDPGTSGGATVVSQGSLPASAGATPATYGYVSASNWNNKKANDTYYVRFNVAAGSPYPPTIQYVRLELTYTTINPSVGVSPTSGVNGTTFTQTGNGFTPSNTATLYFYRPTLGWTSLGASTNSSGSYSNYWTCSSCPAGQYQYYAVDNETGLQSGTTYFTVASVNPSVGVSPSNGSNGTTFTETGSGFMPNGGVTMYFNRPSLGQTTAFISADSNGSYSNYWQCVSCPVGTYQYWAVDNTTGQQSNTVIFNIANPTVSVSPSSGTNGTVFSEPGNGFTPNGTATLYFSGPDGPTTVPNKVVASNGTYSNSWTCTACPVGQYQYYAVDNATGQQSNTVTFRIANPTVSVSPSSGTNGTVFSEPGSGFTPNGTATLYFSGPDGPTTVPNKAIASNGTYSNSWTCTACPVGQYQYYAVDNSTGQQSNTVTFNIANPTVSVSPSSGTNGTTFSEPGSGFTPNGTATLYFNGPDGPSTVPNKAIASNGTYSNSWTCTACPVGQYQYYAVDNATGQQSNTVSFYVTVVVNPQISITPSSGDQGTTFNEPGTGFTPNSTATLHFKLPNGTELPSVSKGTDVTGAYTHSWTSSTSSAVGTYQYWAVDDTTGKASNTATFILSAPSSQPVWVPVYRLYKSADKDHFYTTNAWERDNTVANSGYKYEKIEFYISDRPFIDGIPLYRYYYGADKKHYYTTNTSSAVAGFTEGPGVIGYVYPNPKDGMVPLYHLLGSTDDHFYTISKFEKDNAVTNYSFADQGVQCFVSPSAVANNRPQGDFAGVGMFSGALSVPFNDMTLAGVGPALTLTRYYNSYNQYELPFGGGWSHSLYSYAIDHPNGDVTIKWGIGSEDFFKNDGSGNFSGVNGTFSKLTKVTSDRYDLTAKDQTVYTFARVTINSTMGASFIPTLPLITIADKFSNKVVMIPNAAIGRIDQVYRVVAGVATTQILNFNYDVNNRLTSVVDTSITPNRTISYGYTNGLLSSVTDARGNATSYGYNSDGLLNTITYPEGNTVTVNYDSLQRVTSYTAGTSPNAITLSFEYNATTGTTVKNGATPIVNYVHDADYRAGQITFAGDTTDNVKPTYLTGNQLNLQDTVRDRNGKTSSFTYDANGNMTTATNPLNETTTYTYDLSNNNLLSVKDPRNNTTTYTYDPANGNKTLKSVLKPMGGTTNYTYFANGLVQTVTDPTGHSVTNTYDANGNVTKIQDNQLLTAINYTNDNAGRRISQTDQKSQITTWEYDNNDNVTSVQVASNTASQFRYDRNNRLYNVVDPKGKTTVYTYNTANLMATQQSPDLKTWTYNYDSVGNLSSVTLPGNNTVSYLYYPNNRLNKIRYNSADKITYTYDNNGNVTSVTDADGGGTTSFIYNSANRVTRVVSPFGSMFDYGYDAAGNRTSITYPGSKIVNYTFDADNRLSTVRDWLGTATTTYNYNSAGILQSVTNANGSTTSFTYDTANRLNGLTNKKSNLTVISDYSLMLDNVGNPSSIVRTEPLAPTVPAPSDISYGYNDAHQIQSAGSITYTHDALGNLQTASNGRSFTFDYANRLTGATIGADTFGFVYDAFGNRISRTKNGTQTRYLLDLNAGMSNVLAETDAAGTVQSYYIYGLGLISRIDNAGQRFTYHFDQLGSTVAVTDDSNTEIEKYTYDEFGAELASSEAGGNPFKYVGKYGVMDEGNGLLHMRARYYDTDTGRFLSRDPLGFDGGDLNLYAYVSNSPIFLIDPSGLKPSEKKGNKKKAVTDKIKQTAAEVTKETIKSAIKTKSISLKSVGSGIKEVASVKNYVEGQVLDWSLCQIYKDGNGDCGEDAPWLYSAIVPGSGNAKSAGGTLDPNNPEELKHLQAQKQQCFAPPPKPNGGASGAW